MRRSAIVLLLLGIGGCATQPGTTPTGDAGTLPGTDTGTVAPDAAISTAVTYYGDVRPILAEHCLGCHTPGGIAPIPLDTYESAAPMAGLIESYTAQRRMPPFLADNSGACQHFDTNDWLEDAELATLAAWNAQHAPEGDPTTPPPVVTEVPHLTGAGVQTVDIGVDYAPAAGRSDDYRCFVVQAPRGGFLTGAEVHPGNVGIVHHVIVYAPQDAASAQRIMTLDANEAGPGYTCFGGSGDDAALPVVLWAPGAGAVRMPTGTGLQIDGTLPLIVQVHYNLVGAQPGETDRSTVDVLIEDDAIPGYYLPVANLGFRAPPRMSSTTSSYDFPFGQYYLSNLPGGLSQVHVYSIAPHMHTLGTDIRIDLVDGSASDQCMVHIPRWDFHWQRGYEYLHQVPVDGSSVMRISCTWDTSSRDTEVRWGEGTQDEMCIAFLYVSI